MYALSGAIHENAEAIRLRPDNPNAHYNLALTLESLGQFVRARQELKPTSNSPPTLPMPTRFANT